MKMAKATEKDIDAAGEAMGVLNSISSGYYPGVEDDAPYRFDPDDAAHLRKFYDLMSATLDTSPGWPGRVIGGMCYVIMFEDNRIIDPDSDCLEIHPRFAAPVDMVLFCPRCGTQHVDAPEDVDLFRSTMLQIGGLREANPKPWTNPPHKSHLCHTCGCIWRPADVPTNGVQALKTRGANDSAMGVRNHAVETWTDIDGNLYANGPDGEEVLLRRRASSASGLDRTKGAM
jgi:hypothetical protein